VRVKLMADISAKVILMVPVALEELEMVVAEPDIAKVRIAIASVQSTLRELLAAAHETTTRESSTIPTP
jgi:hypothetical protein